MTAIALVLFAWASSAAAASGHGNPGSVIITGSGSGFYGKDELGDLAQTAVTMLYVLLATEDDEWSVDRRQRHVDGEELCFRVPQAQYGLGLSCFVSPRISLGVRTIWREDLRQNALRRIWGGGPEAVMWFGKPGGLARPYVSAGALFTRGLARGRLEPSVEGLSWHCRSGITVWPAPGVGYTLHAGYQADSAHTATGEELSARAVGFGLGLTLLIE